jgi:indole-3-glycerol phosphate synthase
MQIRRRPPNPAIAVEALSYKIKADDAEPRNILEKIVWHKDKEIDKMRETVPLVDLRKQLVDAPAPLNFLEALRHGKTSPALIAEVKKASPSKGVFREAFNPVEIAQAYAAAGASCLSVLTDAAFFQGSFEYLRQIRQAVQIPLLCKEFVLSPYQIYLARSRGADAILLIASILPDQDLTYFLKIVKSVGMTALVEVHTLAELDRVLALPGVELVGINNRNLEDFSVSLDITCDLIAQRQQVILEKEILIVSESGLHTLADVQTVAKAGAKAILVGESLIKEDPSEPVFESEAARMKAKVSALFGAE